MSPNPTRGEEPDDGPVGKSSSPDSVAGSGSLDLVVVQSVGAILESGATGGGQLVLVRRMQAWASDPSVHLFFLANDKDFSFRLLPGNCDVTRIPSLSTSDSRSRESFLLALLLSPVVQHRALSKFARQHQGARTRTVVVANAAYPAEIWAAAMLKRQIGCPAAAYLHHITPPPWHHPLRRGPLARVVIAWLLNQIGLASAKILGITPIINPNHLERAGWRFAKCIPCSQPSAVDVPHRPVRPWRDRDVAACYIGRIQESKGVLDLAKAWRMVNLEMPEARLVIAGHAYGAEPLGRLKSYVLRTGLSHVVQLLGPVSELEKQELLERSKLMVLPSYEEGWSLSAAEAVVWGAIPCLYDLPAYDYLGSRCVRVPVGDVRCLSQAIIQTLRDPPIPHPTVCGPVPVDWLAQFEPAKVASADLHRIRELLVAPSVPRSG